MKKNLILTAMSSVLLISGTVYAAEKHQLTNQAEILSFSSKTSVDTAASLVQKLKLSNDYGFNKISNNFDKRGNSHTRFQQTYKGVSIWAQQVVTHTQKKKNDLNLSGQIFSKIENDLNGSVIPKFNNKNILEKIKSAAQTKLGELNNFTKENAELIIYVDERFAKAHLAYHVEIMAKNKKGELVRRMYIIDANNGKIYKNWNALMHIDATGPGGNEKTGRYEYGTDYPALQATDIGRDICIMENDNVRAVNLNNSFDETIDDTFEFTCPENTFQEINGGYSPINDAFYFGNVTVDMYKEWTGAAPLPYQLIMKVHYQRDLENAFWSGSYMLFGDGGASFYPLVSLDVSAHEVSHGFTEVNSNLIYSGESGGINEAFSDIAGEAAEFYSRGTNDWLVGAEIFKSEGALRYFEDPTLDGASIKHYADYYNGLDVHLSSGIYNRAFYLLANTEGWGVKKAFEVFASANKNYWMPDSTFVDGGCGLIASAFDLEYQWVDVYNALVAVGLQCTGGSVDEDLDGMSDISELVLGFDPTNSADAETDFDNDGIANRAELSFGTDPKDRDTDDDGLKDNEELFNHSTSPTNDDSDDDGMSDGWEIANSFNPLSRTDATLDADQDGYSNLQEYRDSTDPHDAASFKIQPIDRSGVYGIEDGLAVPNSEMYLYADANFEPTTNQAATGIFSLGSDSISDEQYAAMDWYIDLAEDGEVSFDFKTSTEADYDYFVIYVDYEQYAYASGVIDWQHLSIPITAGSHTITFSYEKDESEKAGQDTVWIDNLNYSGLSFDTDGDGMFDAWEVVYGLDPENAADAAFDKDEDGLTNIEEYNEFTDPTSADTDNDGLTDLNELTVSLTSPFADDTDGDGIKDGVELTYNLAPLDASDGLLDLDSDGIDNRTEAKYETDLNDATSYPQLAAYIFDDFTGELSAKWDVSATKSWGVENEQLYAEPISNENQATAVYTDVFEAGTLTFTVNIDSETDKDLLKVYLDGVLLNTLSGQSSETVSIDLLKGEHSISLSYQKNGILSSTIDRVSIDDMLFIAPELDSDNDGLTNAEEMILGTDITNPDTDGDGISDGDEVANGLDPKSTDTDGDGISDDKDIYPLDAERWVESGGGTMFYILILLPFIFGLRKNIIKK